MRRESWRKWETENGTWESMVESGSRAAGVEAAAILFLQAGIKEDNLQRQTLGIISAVLYQVLMVRSYVT